MAKRLIKNFGGHIAIAHHGVWAPGYTLRVDNLPAVLPDGWIATDAEVELSDLIPSWVQPDGSKNAYRRGDEVVYNGTVYRSVLDSNVWAPDVTGWVVADPEEGVPAWRQPVGAHDAYAAGTIVSHSGKMWASTVAGNVWEPGVSGWRETFRVVPDAPVQIPSWVQPTGAHDAYQIGDNVMHNGQQWRSTAANNVWEPGVYGWEIVNV